MPQVRSPFNGGGIRTVFGNVVNYGTVKTTGTTIQFIGSYTENGAFVSDPATNHFNVLTIGATGYLQGGTGDEFYIDTNLFNSSMQNTLWSTGNALLGFSGTGAHTFSLAGADLGAVMAGYANNFAWGTLNVEGNIYLSDGNSTAGGAQYLSEILGAVIDGTGITNIHGLDGLNIYYLASLDDNAYLHGKTYDMVGGGHLIAVDTANPTPTPEPPVFYLLVIGLIGLTGLQKRRMIG